MDNHLSNTPSYTLSLASHNQTPDQLRSKYYVASHTLLAWFGWNVYMYVASHALLHFYILNIKIRLSM